ncbi:hypothetical protein GA0115252_109210 [Streptomyces sp. DfronAA-171]|nr:hypothetical protein GA0115252_109210 [Streptomyces sp. DfronAA-171]
MSPGHLRLPMPKGSEGVPGDLGGALGEPAVGVEAVRLGEGPGVVLEGPGAVEHVGPRRDAIAAEFGVARGPAGEYPCRRAYPHGFAHEIPGEGEFRKILEIDGPVRRDRFHFLPQPAFPLGVLGEEVKGPGECRRDIFGRRDDKGYDVVVNLLVGQRGAVLTGGVKQYGEQVVVGRGLAGIVRARFPHQLADKRVQFREGRVEAAIGGGRQAVQGPEGEDHPLVEAAEDGVQGVRDPVGEFGARGVDLQEGAGDDPDAGTEHLRAHVGGLPVPPRAGGPYRLLGHDARVGGDPLGAEGRLDGAALAAVAGPVARRHPLAEQDLQGVPQRPADGELGAGQEGADEVGGADGEHLLGPEGDPYDLAVRAQPFEEGQRAAREGGGVAEEREGSGGEGRGARGSRGGRGGGRTRAHTVPSCSCGPRWRPTRGVSVGRTAGVARAGALSWRYGGHAGSSHCSTR